MHLQLFNEFSTLVLIYHLMCFTDFVPDVDTREDIGTSLIYTTCLSLGVNFIFIGSQALTLMVTRLKLRYLRYRKIKKWEDERP